MRAPGNKTKFAVSYWIPEKTVGSNFKGSQQHTVGLIGILNVSTFLKYLCFLLPEIMWPNYHFVLL